MKTPPLVWLAVSIVVASIVIGGSIVYSAHKTSESDYCSAGNVAAC